MQHAYIRKGNTQAFYGFSLTCFDRSELFESTSYLKLKGNETTNRSGYWKVSRATRNPS